MEPANKQRGLSQKRYTALPLPTCLSSLCLWLSSADGNPNIYWSKAQGSTDGAQPTRGCRRPPQSHRRLGGTTPPPQAAEPSARPERDPGAPRGEAGGAQQPVNAPRRGGDRGARVPSASSGPPDIEAVPHPPPRPNTGAGSPPRGGGGPPSAGGGDGPVASTGAGHSPGRGGKPRRGTAPPRPQPRAARRPPAAPRAD